jgi:hypothetical protein
MKLDNITFNRDKKNFVAVLSDSDKEYSLSLLDFEENEVEKATVLASEICSWLELNKQAARVFCASTLLSLKNETWLEEGEAPMTNEKFIETIELDGILAFSDGSFSLYFDDNDIFWGHSIVVEVEEGKLLDADLAG